MIETLAQLAAGFAVALTPYNLMWCLVGVTVGTAIGVLPGLGPALTIALLLPLTYKVDATAAFILFAGIYYGAHVRRLDHLDPAEHAGRERPPSSPRSRATRWPGAAAPARRSQPPPSARSWPAPSARSASRSWPSRW